MTKINILYWFIFPIGLVIIYLVSNQLKFNQNDFVGFAENKQTEINTDIDTKIKKVHVKIGDHVKKGNLLMDVEKVDIDLEIELIDHSISELRLKSNLYEFEIKTEIIKLEKELDNKLIVLKSKIDVEDSESKFYKELMNSTKTTTSRSNIDPKKEYIDGIKNEMNQLSSSYGKQIVHYRKLLNLAKPSEAVKSELLAKKSFLVKEKENFKILAPYDGIVGNINVREGENVRSHASLISFYESTPPMVTGYLHEKFNTNINIGDRVLVSSAYQGEHQIEGSIIGKGHRIIEIPEKFRKFADVKAYGVEVFIKIDSNNHFLQKEVLKIKLIK